jgi:diguanylate cyclase (GGDEF)-like protein
MTGEPPGELSKTLPIADSTIPPATQSVQIAERRPMAQPPTTESHKRTIERIEAYTGLAAEIIRSVVEGKRTVDEASRIVGRMLGSQGDFIERKSKEADTDVLTGLPNRRAFEKRIAELTVAGRRFAIIGVDIDNLKPINDTLGHPAGDEVLIQISRILLAQTRQSGEEDDNDMVARNSEQSDEFSVIVLDVTSEEKIGQKAQAMQDALRGYQPLNIQDREVNVTVSMGAAVPYPEETTDSLIKGADESLRIAKVEKDSVSVRPPKNK